jgi:hypothetical protein
VSQVLNKYPNGLISKVIAFATKISVDALRDQSGRFHPVSATSSVNFSNGVTLLTADA